MSYDPDFATFVHLYKRYQLSAGHQNPTPVPAQRPPGQRPSLARPQQVPYQQAPQRNALELAILRALDDIRRMFNEFKRELESVLVAVNELRNQ